MEEKTSDRQKKSARWLKRMAISIISSLVLGYVVDLGRHAETRAELARLQGDAYVAIAQFAPWNIAYRYIGIVIEQGSPPSFAAEQKQRFNDAFRNTICAQDRLIGRSEEDDPACTPAPAPHGLAAFYLSAHVPLLLRPVTGFFDLLLHAFVDQGVIGFLVAAAQVAIGIFLTRYLMLRKKFNPDSFYSFVLGVPLAVLVLGSVAALPLWLITLIGTIALKGLPATQLGFQGGCTLALTFLGVKVAEEAGHEFVMKQAERFIT